MKNVLVFALSGERYAVELRWVREILNLGHLTPVPTAPPVIAGATNFRGAILPVLATATLVPPPSSGKAHRAPRAGDLIVLLDVDGTRVALGVDRIDAVTTLGFSEQRPEVLVDAEGEAVPLIEPTNVLAAARAQVAEAAAKAAAGPPPGGRPA